MDANDQMGMAGEERSAAQLRVEVERTQDDLHQNVRELNERVNPSRMMSRKKESVTSTFGSAKDKIMGVPDALTPGDGVASSVRQTTQGNPLAAGAVALGVGWIVGGLLPVSETEKQKAAEMVGQAKEHVQPLADQAAEQVQPALNKVNEAVSPT